MSSVSMRLFGAAIIGAFLVSGCVNIDRELATDFAEVDVAVGRRIGVEPVRVRGQSASIAAEVDRLLAAELSEETAVKIAILNSSRIREVYEGLGVRRADLVQAGLLSNPVFSGNAKFFSGATEIEIGIAQSFLEIFYIPLRERVAAARLAAAKASVAREVIATVFAVRRSFVRLLAATEVVEMRRRVLVAAQASSKLMQKLHDAGNVTDPQLTADHAAEARARIDLASAESKVPEARERINVLLGLWGARVAWNVPARLQWNVAAKNEFEGVEGRAVVASLDLAENLAELESLAELAGLESWEAAIGRGEIGPAVKHETDGKWGAGPEVSLALPIFDQGQAKRARAEAMVRAALAHHESLAVEIRSAARTFRERIIALADRTAYVKDVLLPLRARLVGETLQYYNAMQIGAFDVITAKQQEIEAGGEYIELMREARLARLDLEELLAGRLNRDRVESGMPAVHVEGMSPIRKEH